MGAPQSDIKRGRSTTHLPDSARGSIKRHLLPLYGSSHNVVFNAGMQKGFAFERFGRLTLGANFQNVMNHVNYGQPNMTANIPNGGVITSTHIFPAAGAARLGQLVMRYSF